MQILVSIFWHLIKWKFFIFLFAEKVPVSEKTITPASMLTSVDSDKTTHFLSVSPGSPSKSLLEAIQRNNSIAEQTTFLTIYETEEEGNGDENDQEMEVDEKESYKGKQTDADNDNDKDNDESVYFSIRTTREMHNRQNSDDKSVYFSTPSTTENN